MPSQDIPDFDSYDFTAPRGRPTSREASHRNGLSSADDSSYDETKFYVASTNEHDHDESIRIRLPKWLMVYMQDLVRDPRLPAYRSTADVVRDALVHRIHYINENGLSDADTDWIEREVLKGAMTRISSRRQDKLENVQNVKVALNEALASRDTEELEMAMAVASSMAEHIGEPYAEYIRGLIGQVYGDAQNYRNVPIEVMFGEATSKSLR